MRKAVWPTLFIAVFAQMAAAAVPVCCRLFEFDATAILGADPAVCGRILDADERAEAEAATREERRRATNCALEAQTQGRAFVYTYRLLVAPDVDMIIQAVFGAHGERMLMKLGNFRSDNIRTVEVCQALTVLPDGKVKDRGCYRNYP